MTPSGDLTIPTSPFAAYVVSRRGGKLTQQVTTLELSDLPDGDTVVRVDWSAVNYKDGMVATPGNRVARADVLVPGVDAAGTVVESATMAPGTPVVVHGYDLGVGRHGAFARYLRVPHAWVVPLPSGLSTRHAALIGTAGFTAALSARRLAQGGVAPGDGPVLVTGASGGVGSMAVALLARRGYSVVASTGKADEHDYLRSLGAASVIGRDLVERPERVLGPERWYGAVDCVGGNVLAAVLRSMRYGGVVAASGLTGGSELSTTVYPFIVRAVSLIGIDTVQTPIDERVAVWSDLATAFDVETLDAMVAKEVGLDELSEALATIIAGGVRGRILVQPGR